MERYLIEQESVGLFLAYFLAFWNAWKVGGNYGLKYNNVDLTHKLFWTGYGLCVVGMLQHTAGGVNGSNAQGFAVSSAMLHVLIGLQVCVQCSSLSLALPTVAVATVDSSAAQLTVTINSHCRNSWLAFRLARSTVNNHCRNS